MKYLFLILLVVVTLIGCGNNRTDNTNNKAHSDSTSTLDISRKSGTNTGDSLLNKPDSLKGK